MDRTVLRILDAAANRAREALRVLEDVVRFGWDDEGLMRELKELRHEMAGGLGLLPMAAAMGTRDTAGDVGTSVKTDAEFCRGNIRDILTANCKRLTEALRSLEEFAKTVDTEAAGRFEQMRYRAYTLEKKLLGRAAGMDARRRFEKVRLYVLLTESICALPWEQVLREILAAGGERLCVQLREKNVADGELLRRARIIADQCRQAGAISMVNDRADIALLAGADGVHVGQTDLRLEEVGKILPSGAITGISTENIEQARSAVGGKTLPTYLAVGPMFHTMTKEKPRIAGPAYAAEVVREIKLPVAAIGGITLENAAKVTAAGVRTLAVSAAVLKSARPGEMVEKFLSLIPSTVPA